MSIVKKKSVTGENILYIIIKLIAKGLNGENRGNMTEFSQFYFLDLNTTLGYLCNKLAKKLVMITDG